MKGQPVRIVRPLAPVALGSKLKLSSDGYVLPWLQLHYVVYPCQFVAPFSEPLLDVLELSLLRKLTEVQVATTTENAPEQLGPVRGAHKAISTSTATLCVRKIHTRLASAIVPQHGYEKRRLGSTDGALLLHVPETREAA